MTASPLTDNLARGNHVVPTEFAQDLERELAAAHKRSDRLEQALRALVHAAHQRFMQQSPIHDYARLEFFAALEQARTVLKSPISNLQS